MATTVSISINLPSEVLAQAQAMAVSDDRPLEQIVAIAINRYAYAREAVEELFREGHEYGRKIGITCEEDVERVANGEITLEQLRRPA